MGLLFLKEAELKGLKNSQRIHIAKTENTNGVARKSFDKFSVYQPSQQRSDAVLQDNGRMTLKLIQRTPQSHHRNRVQWTGGREVSGCPCPVPQGWDLHRRLQCGLCLLEPWGVRPLRRAMDLGPQPGRYRALAENHSGDRA